MSRTCPGFAVIFIFPACKTRLPSPFTCTTVAAVRAGCGSAAPFDILPAVWVSSVLSVTAGLLAARLLERVVR